MSRECSFQAKHAEDGMYITISGDLISSTAPDVNAQIDALGDEITQGNVVFDLAGLTTVSSAGLRLFMRLQQRLPNKITLLNVTAQVYEVFALTGMTELMHVERASREVSVEGCEVVGHGASGVVYRLDDDTVVKLYPAGYPTSALVLERESARTAFIKGVPTAIPFDMVRDGDRYGLAYELVQAQSLQSLLVEHPELLDEYLDKLCDLYRSFHEIKDSSHVYPSAKDLLLEKLGKCEQWYGPDIVREVCQVVERIPDRDVLLHGDFHPGNILVDATGELTVLDLGEIAHGHPVFDLMSFALHYPSLYRHEESRTVCAFFHGGMTPEMHERVWDGFIQRTYADRSADERARVDVLAEQLASCLEAATPLRAANMTEDKLNISIRTFLEKWESCRETLLKFDDFDLFL